MSFEKCSCVHCGQHVEYPSEGIGMTIPCPTCNKPVVLKSSNQPTKTGPISIPPAPPIPTGQVRQEKQKKTRLSSLTELTIRNKTQRGETPLHRAAKLGRFAEIPHHLLKAELFMAKDCCGETPLHFAARHGSLNQVPPEFLTGETLTVRDDNACTPLHTAVSCGHADQIPKQFLSPDFLRIRAGFRYGGELHEGDTLLHILAGKNQLGIVPAEYITPEMCRLKNYYGHTPAEVLEDATRQSAWRTEPATEKQKVKLRWFGCTWAGEITKGEASDAITECVKRFPQLEGDYYNRPATEEQLAQLPPRLRTKGLTYGSAKDLISEYELDERER